MYCQTKGLWTAQESRYHRESCYETVPSGGCCCTTCARHRRVKIYPRTKLDEPNMLSLRIFRQTPSAFCVTKWSKFVSPNILVRLLCRQTYVVTNVLPGNVSSSKIFFKKIYRQAIFPKNYSDKLYIAHKITLQAVESWAMWFKSKQYELIN